MMRMTRTWLTKVVVLLGLALPAWAAVDPENEINPPSDDDLSVLEKVIKMRDPFLKPDLKALIRAGVPKSELQFYPVQEFELTGVVVGPQRLRAMLQAPNGKVFFVKENDKIGIKNGFIKKIQSDTLTVRETELNLLGREEEVLTVLRLREKKGSPNSAQDGFSTLGRVEVIRGKEVEPPPPNEEADAQGNEDTNEAPPPSGQ